MAAIKSVIYLTILMVCLSIEVQSNDEFTDAMRSLDTWLNKGYSSKSFINKLKPSKIPSGSSNDLIRLAIEEKERIVREGRPVEKYQAFINGVEILAQLISDEQCKPQKDREMRKIIPLFERKQLSEKLYKFISEAYNDSHARKCSARFREIYSIKYQKEIDQQQRLKSFVNKSRSMFIPYDNKADKEFWNYCMRDRLVEYTYSKPIAPRCILKRDLLVELVDDLSQQDPERTFDDTKLNRAQRSKNFDLMFNKYFIENCELWTELLGQDLNDFLDYLAALRYYAPKALDEIGSCDHNIMMDILDQERICSHYGGLQYEAIEMYLGRQLARG